MNEAKGRGVNTQEQTQGRCFLQTHPELWNPSTQSVLTCPYLQPCFPAYLAHSPNGCGGNTWSATGWATGRLQARSPLHSQGLPSTADAWTRGKSLFPQTFPHQKRVPLCSVGTSLKGQGSVHPCGWTGKRRRGSEPLGSPLSKAPAAPPTSSLHTQELFRLGCRIPVCSSQRSRPPLNFLVGTRHNLTLFLKARAASSRHPVPWRRHAHSWP